MSERTHMIVIPDVIIVPSGYTPENPISEDASSDAYITSTMIKNRRKKIYDRIFFINKLVKLCSSNKLYDGVRKSCNNKSNERIDNCFF